MFELQSFTNKKTSYIQKNTPKNKIPPQKTTIQRSDLCRSRLGRLAKVVDFDDVGGEALVRLMWREIFFWKIRFLSEKKTMDFFTRTTNL